MDSAMIGKIEKAMRYAQETDRIIFNRFQVSLNGDHREHVVSYDKGNWTCDCGFFTSRRVCSHTMAMERILGGMLKPEW